MITVINAIIVITLRARAVRGHSLQRMIVSHMVGGMEYCYLPWIIRFTTLVGSGRLVLCC